MRWVNVAKRKTAKRRTDQYQLPPHVAEAQQYAARRAAYRPRPALPQWRLIAGAFGVFILTVGLALFLWIPARSLVTDLRSSGVTVAATVTGVDSKPKFVKVRFGQGPEEGNEIKLSEYAGMLPDVRADEALLVTYDPDDPSRALPHSWVVTPPPNLPAYGTAGLALIILGLTIAVVLRRRWILRTPWPEHPMYGSSDPVNPGSATVRVVKP
ncbi:hypothetical protein GCM10010297_67160 [Streptomyces malachitofuscus]|nr:hypothetical protein GCM10010297_67160 [Streptomyces malachitofuscus]